MTEQPKADIDLLAPLRSHINLADRSLPGDFGLDDFVLSKLMADVILVEFCDLQSGEDGVEFVMRGGLAIPVNQVHNLWRKGRVILKGPYVKFTEVGEIVIFPANMGIPVSNLQVKGHGFVTKGLFLNEDRMFGMCEKSEQEEHNEN